MDTDDYFTGDDAEEGEASVSSDVSRIFQITVFKYLLYLNFMFYL